jgi:mannose-6-phosphate isomerase-like protein (cupin superfamily)
MAVVRALADMEVSPTASLFEGRKYADVELSFFVTSTPPGGGPPLHVHPYAEVFLVQEGTATFTAGDERLVVTEGHVVVVAAETPHRYENRGEGTLRQVSIHPSGEVQQTWLETD